MGITKRIASAVAAAVLLASSCGGTQEIYEVPPGQISSEVEGLVTLPDPVPAAPAFSVHSNRPLKQRDLDRLTSTPGTAVVVPAAVTSVSVEGPKGKAKLRVAALDPLAFRSVAPPSTRDAEFVWLTLLAGDAVVTQKASKQLGLGQKTGIDIDGVGELSVGAFADNGRPNLFDLILDAEANELGAKPTVAVVGAESGVTLETLKKDIRKRMGEGVRIKRLHPAGQPVAPTPGTEQPTQTIQVALPSAAGLHPAMAQAVGELLSAAGGRVWVVSGYRDPARQYQLWIQALKKYGSPAAARKWVAPPGHSMHERGLAVDLGGDLALAARLVNELGIPLWRPMSWEPWHFELAGSR